MPKKTKFEVDKHKQKIEEEADLKHEKLVNQKVCSTKSEHDRGDKPER